MATKDVLEALAAGAGRQSAIGGLMFQDAQKREAQGYELALQKEKWRRSGETAALDNARKGYKSLMENSRRDYDTYISAIVRAKSGGTDESYPGAGTAEGLAQLESKAAELWETYQYASRKYAEYAGIDWVPTAQPKIAGGVDAEAVVTDPLVEAAAGELEKKGTTFPGKYEELVLIGDQMAEGKDWGVDERVESANAMLVAQGKKKLAAEGKNIETYSLERLHEMFDMTPKQEDAFRKKIMAAVQPLTRRASGWASLDEGSYPQGERLYSQAERKELESRYEATGAPIPNYSDPAGIRDPFFIEQAEDRAVKREKEKGTISQADFSRAYIEAQKALTEILTQTGTVTKEQFMALVQQNEVKGIKLKAYQKAFQDIMKGR